MNENFSNELSELHERVAELEELADERSRTISTLTENAEKYRSLLESTEDAIYMVDRDCKYLFMNGRHIKRLEISEDPYLNKAYSEFHSNDETKWFVEHVEKDFKTGASVQYEHKSLRDGRYFLLTLSPLEDEDGKLKQLLLFPKI